MTAAVKPSDHPRGSPGTWPVGEEVGERSATIAAAPASASPSTTSARREYPSLGLLCGAARKSSLSVTFDSFRALDRSKGAVPRQHPCARPAPGATVIRTWRFRDPLPSPGPELDDYPNFVLPP